MRIDKYICDCLNITRTQAKNKIAKGEVSADGSLVRSSSFQIDENTAVITVGGVPVNYSKYFYIMMNKPAGVLSASADKRCKTAIDLLDDKDKRDDLFIAGRLDKDTTGLLIITNDGDFAHNILSPKKHVFKTYIAELEKDILDNYAEEFEKGIVLADGYTCKSAAFTKIDNRKCKLEIREGKFHQIKRMFAALDNRVVSLKRIKMGTLLLDNSLGMGEYRHFNDNEMMEFVDKMHKNDTKKI